MDIARLHCPVSARDSRDIAMLHCLVSGQGIAGTPVSGKEIAGT